jgi:hypothetical protein
MKCPYTVNVEQVNQNSYEYDADGQNVFHEHKLFEYKQFVKCLESECAVWINGRCNYNQGHNG